MEDYQSIVGIEGYSRHLTKLHVSDLGDLE